MAELESILNSKTIDIPQEEFSILEKMAKDNNRTVDIELSAIIKEKADGGLLTKNQAIIVTLELVNAQINETDDIGTIRSAVATDLLVAKIGLDFDQTGKINKEKIKGYIQELF